MPFSNVVSRLPRRVRSQFAPDGKLDLQEVLCALRYDRLACRQIVLGTNPRTMQYRLAMIRQTRIAIRSKQ